MLDKISVLEEFVVQQKQEEVKNAFMGSCSFPVFFCFFFSPHAIFYLKHITIIWASVILYVKEAALPVFSSMPGFIKYQKKVFWNKFLIVKHFTNRIESFFFHLAVLHPVEFSIEEENYTLAKVSSAL